MAETLGLVDGNVLRRAVQAVGDFSVVKETEEFLSGLADRPSPQAVATERKEAVRRLREALYEAESAISNAQCALEELE